MKKFFSLVGVLLMFSGCADLSMSKEEALRNELPEDFDWKIYAEINNDVAQFQIIIDVEAKVSVAYASSNNATVARKEDCVRFLKDETGKTSALAEKIYLNYVGCPKKGWNPNESCPGVYAQVEYYNRTGGCNIGGCYSGGWDENEGLDKYCEENGYEKNSQICIDEYIILGGEVDFLVEKLPAKISTYLTSDDVQLKTICKFVLPNVQNSTEAENYLKNFPYDSILIEQHYFMLGRSEGKPYKYCEKSVTDDNGKILKDRTLADTLGNKYFDYSEHSFCLDTLSQGIYLLKK